MVYKRRGRPSWYFEARTQTGWKALATRTTSKQLAAKLEAMWSALATEHRAWDLLGHVLAGELTIGRLFDVWQETRHDVAEMRRRLADVDLDPLVAEWHAAYRDGVTADTAAHALAHVRYLLPAGERRLASSVTATWLTERLHSYRVQRAPAKGSSAAPARARRNTLRKVHSSWTMFFDYLTRVRALYQVNPMQAVERPKVEKKPVQFYELHDVERIVGAAPSREMRALWALLYGTGMEISVALALRVDDVSGDRREVRAAGTKAHKRDRVARIADWALPIVREYLTDKLPGAHLWPGWNRWSPRDVHQATTQALGLRYITLYNARHHWAVRQLRAGAPVRVVQFQLGHSTPMLTLDTYGAFIPQGTDRDHWEAEATKLDERRRGVR